MKFALFNGCKIPYYLPHYATATIAVLETLGVELVDIQFNCCGYPTRNLHFDAYILSAAKNLAKAEREGLSIVTPCMCCFGSLKHAMHWLSENAVLKDKTNKELSEENLSWNGQIEVKHILSVLAEDVDQEDIESKIKYSFKDLKIANHYGCHALRPSKVMKFDNPADPNIFESLVSLTGATSIPWSKRLSCCGNSLMEKNDTLSIKIMGEKLENAWQAGADYLCTACNYCQMQFDMVQEDVLSKIENTNAVPSILFPQLLGLTMGISEDVLGLKNNKIDISGITKYLS